MNNLQLELLTRIDMQLKVEKGIKDGIFHSVLRYAKAENKYIRNHSQNKESSYLALLDKNGSYG